MASARIAKGDLAGLDALQVDSLAFGLFNHLRQPLLVPGFVDWRLCGRIGRMVSKRKLKGEAGETVLMSALGRIGKVERIFIFGLGSPRELAGSELDTIAKKMVSVLADAKATKVALAGSGSFLSHWLEAASGAGFEEVVLLDPDGSLAENSSRLAAAAKKGGFELLS